MIRDQFKERIFAGRADSNEVCDIDDKFTAIEMLLGLRVLAKEFGDPGLNECTLDHQSASALALNERDLQHATLFRGAQECNTLAKVCSSNNFSFQDGIEISRNEVAVSIWRF
jgi:hypothetical protein